MPEKTNKIGKAILLSTPIWLPFVYSVGVWLELKTTHNGPLNQLAIYALFGAPVFGGLPILFSSQTPVLGKIILFPLYYFIGVFVAGFLGWGLCMEMRTCN